MGSAGFCWVLVSPDGSWRALAISSGLRRPCPVSAGRWRVLMAAGGLYQALMTAGGRSWILIGPTKHRLSLAVLTRLADLLAERHERPNAAPAGALDGKNATCCSEERCRSISGIVTMKCRGFRRESVYGVARDVVPAALSFSQ
jgi:hypothetical protein